MLALLVCAATALNAQAATKVKDPSLECRYKRTGRWSDQDVKATIRCATRKWSVPGGYAKARAVAACESGFNEHDRNSSSSAAGVYQFLSGTWASVLHRHHHLAYRWGLSDRVLNARANVVRAIQLAHGGGWGPWSCA